MKLGPDEVWPTHGSPFWRETLNYARGWGWRLTPHSAHSFGTLECESGVCAIKIFSTAKGSENVALGARKLIDQCVHGTRTSDSLVVVDDRLRKAQDLVEAAEAMVAKDRAVARAEDLLTTAGVLIGEVAAAVEFDLLAAQIEAADTQVDALRVAVGPEMPDSARQAADSAAGHVGAARVELGRVPRLVDAVKLRQEVCKKLTKRIAAVRKALRL